MSLIMFPGRNRPSLPVLSAIGIVLVALLMLSSLCLAQVRWAVDGVELCAEAANQRYPRIAPDGAGGAIIAWWDMRDGNQDIYARRVDSDGTPLWDADGVPVCTAIGAQRDQRLVSDGAGGAIITWEDDRDGNWDIYAQMVDSFGNRQWENGPGSGDYNGIPVCTAVDPQLDPRLTTDGAGGSIITWQDDRSVDPFNEDIYAQRVDSDGTPLWDANGIPVCETTNHQISPDITTDGSQGAIITWCDSRIACQIYAQRVDPGGTLLWAEDGVPIATDAGTGDPRISSDGMRGAIITWKDVRSGNWDIYAQEVDAEGAVGWTDGGVAVCDANGEQRSPELTSDGAGGAIITWQDHRTDNWDIHTQRLDAEGAVEWSVNGVVICEDTYHQVLPRIVSDGCHGAIITWQGKPEAHDDVFAQRVDPAGVPKWTIGGISICGADGDQIDPRLTGDGQGGAVITWQDQRDGNWDAYAQKVSDYAQEWYLAEGSTGTNEFGTFETWVLVQNPGDSEADVQLYYQTPDEEILGHHLTLDPQTRQTVNVSDYAPDQFSVSTRVESDTPVIAERAMYWTSVDGTYRQSGHDSIGVTCPTYDWYLAEGSTGTNELGSFETWVLVQNPGGTEADVQLYYQTPDEEVVGHHLTLDPYTRQTVNVSDYVPDQFSVSTRVQSDTPVIAERAMYWTSAVGVYRQAGHDSRGVTTPATTWYLAEGSTGANESGSFETWILVQNPGDVVAEVEVYYQTTTTQVLGHELTLEPHTRQSVSVGEVVPGRFSVSTMVVSDNPVIAERAMYWTSAGGVYRQSGHDSIGVTTPAATWYLAEGSTGTDGNGSFETWILVQNPGDTEADVQLYYQTTDEEILGHHLTLDPHTRQTVNVSDYAPDQFSVSTRVQSDTPVIAERAMYWTSADGVYRQAGHDSIGFTMR